MSTVTPSLTLEEFLTLPETEPASEFSDGRVIQKPIGPNFEVGFTATEASLTFGDTGCVGREAGRVGREVNLPDGDTGRVSREAGRVGGEVVLLDGEAVRVGHGDSLVGREASLIDGEANFTHSLVRLILNELRFI